MGFHCDIIVTSCGTLHILNILYGKDSKIHENLKNDIHYVKILKDAINFIINIDTDIHTIKFNKYCNFYHYCHKKQMYEKIDMHILYLIMYNKLWHQYHFNVKLKDPDSERYNYSKKLNMIINLPHDEVIKRFFNVINPVQMKQFFEIKITWGKLLKNIIEKTGYKIVGTHSMGFTIMYNIFNSYEFCMAFRPYNIDCCISHDFDHNVEDGTNRNVEDLTSDFLKLNRIPFTILEVIANH